jgi:hypothetical protein
LIVRYKQRGGTHLLWWSAGVFFYGLGTALESSITLFGNTVILNKAWYIAGALLGGYPLAQGSLFLLAKRRTAVMLTAISLPVVVVGSLLVAASPVLVENMEAHRPSGAILGWQWVRFLTPFVNLYAVIFLIGGALASTVHFARRRGLGDGARALGNASIAFGALLPGIGGSMAKTGVVEALYVGELVGLLFIVLGFAMVVGAAGTRAGTEPAPSSPQVTEDEPLPA